MRKIEVTATEQVRYKAKLVAWEFTQNKVVDYNDIFSHVVQHTSIWLLLGLVAQYDMEFQQLDVKTAFLDGDLEETIYMCQLEGRVNSI